MATSNALAGLKDMLPTDAMRDVRNLATVLGRAGTGRDDYEFGDISKKAAQNAKEGLQRVLT